MFIHVQYIQPANAPFLFWANYVIALAGVLQDTFKQKAHSGLLLGASLCCCVQERLALSTGYPSCRLPFGNKVTYNLILKILKLFKVEQ